MRVVRARFFILVFFAGLIVWCLYIWVPLWSYGPPPSEVYLKKEEIATEQACHHPELDPFNPVFTRHIRDLGELSCDHDDDDDWLEVNQGFVSITKQAIKNHGKITCILKFITRVNDFTVKKDTVISLTIEQPRQQLKEDFFVADCTSANDGKTWTSVMAGIVRNESAVQRAHSYKLSENALGLNVLIFGLDSMSHLHYIRKLPKTYKYLTEILNATVLEGYNIVGDGTPQALIPILTGFTEPELPETRKRMKNANYVNIYPFAWKNFTANGYVTAFGEDLPSTGIFTYRLKGFDEEPTDHYMRTFYVEVDKVIRNHPKLCLGNTPRHKVMLHWLRQFFEEYSDVPKFAFGFHGELSHDDYNLVGYADKDIHDFLQDLHQSGILNNTFLLLMSDHGHRFASIRETQQGKQEERLPFFALVPPPWLELSYQRLMQNLRANKNRLTTPFDIHATLMTILNPNIPQIGNVNSRSISLFSLIPQERTCSNADIEPHWCACLAWHEVSPSDSIAVEAGQAVVDFINEYTMTQRSLCAKLVLDKVTRAESLLPNKAMLKFKKNADKDGFVGDFSDNTQVSEVIYQVQIHTFPNKAIYEASTQYNVQHKTFKVKEQEISRVNIYGNQPHCTYETHPHLRKYCYCKVQL